MNDRHPSGSTTPPAPATDASSALYASYAAQGVAYGDLTTYDTYGQGYDTGTQAPQEYATGVYATTGLTADPLTGQFPAGTAETAAYGYGYGTGGYDTVGYGASYDDSAWSTGAQQVFGQDSWTTQQPTAQDTGSYDTTAWTTTGYDYAGGVPAQAEQHAQADETQQWAWGAQTHDSGAYDATQWNSGDTREPYEPAAYGHTPYDPTSFEQTPFDQAAYGQAAYGQTDYDRATYDSPAGQGDLSAPRPEGFPADEPPGGGSRSDTDTDTDTEEPPFPEDEEESEPVVSAHTSSRPRRRSPAKRSALLTVAVPSVCVMGVAGVAAASVGGGLSDGESDTTASAPDRQQVKPSVANNKLDTQLQSLSAGADDFADRASRTQERIDLKAQQEAERKKAAEEAARKERLRPKFVLPVDQHGLSAYYGQAGVNWMSVHSGIDFPVSYGTTVRAATDGTVSTKWNSAYGNMLVLTAMDGTETWYCHLSSYQVASGTTVKAGDPIAFSGNSGNSTGPHLHFEVRPGGGEPIDPLPWLRSHGVEPT